MDPTLCDECGQWPMCPGDRFCGWCGAPLLELALLRTTGERLGPSGRDYVVPGQARVHYRLRQRGSMSSAAPRVRRAGGEPCPTRPTDRPGEHEIAVDFVPARRGPARLALEVAGRDRAWLSLPLELWPRPEIVPRPDPGGLQFVHEGALRAAFTDPRRATEPIVLRVAIPDSPVVVRRVGLRTADMASPAWDRAGTATTPELILRCDDVGREVGLQRELPLVLERRGPWERGREMSAHLSVAFEGLPVWELAVVLVQRRRIGGDFSPELCQIDRAWCGRVAAYPCHLANEDDFDLRIVEATAEPAWLRVGAVGPATARADEVSELALPVHLQARTGEQRGGHLDFAIVVDGRHPQFPKAGAGPQAGQVRFVHASGLTALYGVRIGEIAQPASLAAKGYLAVDFGTTNTCCALKLEGRDVEVLPFGADARSSIPSVVFFEDLSDPERPKFCVGNAALAQAKLRGERSLVRSFKRRIGLDRREPVIDPLGRAATYLPDDLARFFLGEVLREVKEVLDRRGAPIEVDRVFFTHPVLFSPRQLERLAAVFASVGARSAEPALDEASAGAVRAIHAWATEEHRALEAARAPWPPARTEHVLNYDFGGGTIDIALLEVTVDHAARIVESTPVGVTGLYRFGGEDITVLVRRMITQMIERKMRRRHPRFRLPTGDPAREPALYQIVRENNARLGFLAEKAKIEVLRKGTYTIRPTDPDLDQLSVDKGAGAGFERVDAVRRPLFDGLGEAEAQIVLARSDLERLIEPRIRESADRAYNLWRACCANEDGTVRALDRVLLTGRSSSIPLVARVLAERLGVASDRIFHDPASAKEVVAQGACYHREMAGALQRGVKLVLGDVGSRVLIPIGLEQIDYAESVFEPIFDARTRLERVVAADGAVALVAEKSIELSLVGPTATIKLFRSLDYVPGITSGGKDLVARFELAAKDPFFADWTPRERAAFTATFRLSRVPGSGAARVDVVLVHPRTNAVRVLGSGVDVDLAATVGEGEEAAGLLAGALEIALESDPKAAGADREGWS